MAKHHFKYICYPSVVPVGKEITVTVFPKDISRRFRDTDKVELSVVELWGDEHNYHAPVPKDHACTIQNGLLSFTHTFEAEMEYSIRFSVNNQKEVRVAMYALEDDLYQLRPLKGDLHSHSYYSDGSDGLAMVPADYREEGFDFFALTDHNRMYTSQCAKDLYKDVNVDVCMLTGEEVHTPGSLLHLVHVGGSSSVCDQYISDPEGYQAKIAEIAKGLDYVDEQYRDRVAMAKWACDEIHKAGGLAIYAHPFWRPNRYNINAKLNEYLLKENIFDALEIVGGVNYRSNNLQLAMHREFCPQLSVVGSSDSHNHCYETSGFARRFTYVFAKDNTTESILEAIKKGYCVAGEKPAEDDNEVRFYGSLRLVMFSHFLYESFFPFTYELCRCEGTLLRRYAEGEDVGQQLNELSGTVYAFYQKFYGLMPAPVLSADRQEFLDRCLDLQINRGPATKGSSLFFYGGNERRE